MIINNVHASQGIFDPCTGMTNKWYFYLTIFYAFCSSEAIYGKIILLKLGAFTKVV